MSATIDLGSRVRAAYSAGRNPSLDEILTTLGTLHENELADLIELDGRTRLEAGLPVELGRYLRAVPDLVRKRIALDAAVEFAIRGGVQAGQTEIEAAEALCRKHPELSDAIMLAVALNEGVCSTTSLRRGLKEPESLPLPQDLGPALADGRSRYELRQLLGSGAQGRVYSALDRAMSEPDRPAWVAIKVLHPGADDPFWRALFNEEGLKARRIEHPNVVRALDRGSDARLGDYAAFEQIDGGSLAGLIESRRGPLAAREAAMLMSKICRGVHAAHLAGLLHCDLKPSNVLLTREGEPKVSDFGTAARLKQPGGQRTPQRIGNVAFMAPEQARSADRVLAVTVDVYALGGLLYLLLTGALPGIENDPTLEPEKAEKQAGGSPAAINPLIDHDLDAICRRALELDPAARYGSADAMAADLDAWLAHKPIDWTRPSASRRVRLLCRRQPLAVAIAVVGLVLAFATTAGTVYSVMDARQRLLRQRLEASEKLVTAQREGADRLLKGFQVMRQGMLRGLRGMVTSEWLAPMAILESATGPILFDPKVSEDAFFTSRAAVAEQLIAKNQAEGHGDSIESLLWNDILAFWSVRSGDLAKATAALDASESGWGRLLGPGDPWRTVRDSVRASIRVQQASRDVVAGERPGIDELELLAGDLERLYAEAARRPAGDALQLLLASDLVAIYDAPLLNQPDKRDAARDVLTKFGVPPPAPEPR